MPSVARFSRQPRFTLPGSEKQPLTVETSVLPASGLSTPEVLSIRSSEPRSTVRHAAGAFTVSVVVKPKQRIDPSQLGKPASRISRAEFARRHGPDPASIKAVSAFAREFGLAAKAPAPGRRAVQLSGTVAAMQKAFGVQLQAQRIGKRSYRIREGAITLPRGLYGHVEAVLGLDNRRQASPHFRSLHPASGIAAAKAAPERQPAGSFTPEQVAELYGFPAGGRADGEAIGLIELDGGFRPKDIAAYFKSLGQPAPKMVVVSVDGAKNSPTGHPSGPDGEVLLDIEVAAAVAPGATIVVYFAPNTDKGFVDAIATAVHDKANHPSVISISWGAAEAKWTQQSMTVLDEACQSAAALGVSITVAAGDNGSTDAVNDGNNHVDFPASSPHVLACGGTKLIGTGSSIHSEVVWDELATGNGATGGGVSTFFPLPAWQEGSRVPKPSVAAGGRGVPDVAGNADPFTGYVIRVDGVTSPIGGTSAVAPLWAGLIALSNAHNKSSAGFLNPKLYAAKGKGFHDILSGTNPGFKAGPGWDACTGLGSPVGTEVIALSQSSSGKKRH
jgi:kumamolisin